MSETTRESRVGAQTELFDEGGNGLAVFAAAHVQHHDGRAVALFGEEMNVKSLGAVEHRYQKAAVLQGLAQAVASQRGVAHQVHPAARGGNVLVTHGGQAPVVGPRFPNHRVKLHRMVAFKAAQAAAEGGWRALIAASNSISSCRAACDTSRMP
ncbi:MAG: hypothetical protein R3E56_12000 [Burkholderiaceae bacterium]